MSAYDPIRVRALGLAHRLSFLYVPAWYLLSVPGGARLLSYAVWLMVPFMAFCAYRLARAMPLPMRRSVVFTIAASIPLIGIIPFAYLSYQAAKILKSAGVPVGFLGPRKADLPSATSDKGQSGA
jgi:hypothetical protein